MSVRKAIPNKDGLYFITITCVEWLWLFEVIKDYDIVIDGTSFQTTTPD